MKIGLFLAAIVLFVVPGRSETIPLTHATALSGRQVTLPADLKARSTVLVLGFTQKSSDACSAWGQQIAAMTAGDSRVVNLQMPVLESVPRWIRGMVVHSMKGHVPVNLQGTFVPVFENETEWKHVVGFSAPDDAYVVVADAQGRIVWQAHGAVTDAQMRELKVHLAR
jgi:hypothetical protein